MSVEVETVSPSKQPPAFVDRWWHARIWHGMKFSAWWRMLIANRFRVSPHRIPAALIICGMSALHSALRFVQWLIFGWPLSRTRIEQPPIFIIGHWRSGTTFLHELLCRDETSASPTNYQCFAPHHFLLTEWLVTRCFNWLLPERRPMDNMAVGWNRPQEDEFALCAMGQPSLYWTLAFPRFPAQQMQYLDFAGLPRPKVEKWQAALHKFVRLISYKHGGKRIVLKSPTHTARVGVLRELYPDARFIHIVRDPYELFQSTVKMWKRMSEAEHLRTPNFEGIEQHVFETLNRMYAAFERDKEELPADRYYEVRYEDLVRDPEGELERMYARLDLGDFDLVRPAIREHLAEVEDYQPNRHVIPDELKAEINLQWAGYMETFGYAGSEEESAADASPRETLQPMVE